MLCCPLAPRQGSNIRTPAYLHRRYHMRPKLYEGPCFRVPFWATPMRLSLRNEDPPPVPKYHYARESLILTCLFWSITLWSISYTVSASIFSGSTLLISLAVIGSSILFLIVRVDDNKWVLLVVHRSVKCKVSNSIEIVLCAGNDVVGGVELPQTR